MQKTMIGFLFAIMSIVVNNKICAQATIVITGNIKNSQTQEELSAVSVTIKGGTSGTFTDEKGNFRLVTAQKPPFVIEISSIGYTSKEINVENESQVLNVELEPGFALGQEIVV